MSMKLNACRCSLCGKIYSLDTEHFCKDPDKHKKVAVIGSRKFEDYDLLKKELDKIYNISCIVSGGASGADSLAENYAEENNIETLIYKADWNDMSEPCVVGKNPYGEYNKLAGFKRNTQIVEDADLIVAFWDGISKGTKDSIDKAKKLNKKIIVVRV